MTTAKKTLKSKTKPRKRGSGKAVPLTKKAAGGRKKSTVGRGGSTGKPGRKSATPPQKTTARGAGKAGAASPASTHPPETGETFGTLEDHRRTRRINPPRSEVERWALKAKDCWESALTGASWQGDPAVYETSEFSWAAELEAHWKSIRSELDSVLDRRSELPSFQEIMSQVSTITNDSNWKTFFLFAPGMDCSGNRAKCPRTTELVQRIPGLKTAMFSILSPHKHIPAHRGPYAGVLRYHLGLIVPEPRKKCRIRIGNRAYHWDEGRSIIFDDTWNHEVWNETDGVRVVLFVDFTRPVRWPYNWLNGALMKAAEFAPFIRATGAAQQRWENRFYRK